MDKLDNIITSWGDIFCLAILVFFVILGVKKGFVSEVITIFFWLLGFYLATNKVFNLEPLLQGYTQDATAIKAFSFSIVFLITVIIGYVLAAIMTKFFSILQLGIFNRILGGVLGFIKGSFIILVIIYFIDIISADRASIAGEQTSLMVYYVDLLEYLDFTIIREQIQKY